MGTCINAGKRLPTIDEILVGLTDQFVNGGSNPGGFIYGFYYWTNNEVSPTMAYASAYPFVANGGFFKGNHYIFRCVK